MPTNNRNNRDRRIENFKVFEAKLRRNRAFSNEYLDDIQKRGEQESMDLQDQGANIGNIMGFVNQLMEIQGSKKTESGSIEWQDREKKEKLETLVVNIINKEYGALIDALDVELDIKLVDGDDNLQQGADEMQLSPEDIELSDPNEEEEEDGDEDSDDENEEEQGGEQVEVTEDDILAEVDKRKIINNVTQGSAKNVHRLMHLYKEEIDEIDPRLFEVMDRLIKSQESFEWDPNNPLANSDGSGQVLRDHMNGYAKLEFKDDEDDGGEDDSEYPEEEEEELNFDDMEADDFKGATLKARAIDIVVLLHESVKVIYEMLGSAGIPEDEEIAKIVMNNTDTLDDEFEDLRYGVYIRRDLLAFVSVNPALESMNNGFEYVWGRLVEMPAQDFTDLFQAMLIDEFKERQLRVKVRESGNKFKTISGTSRQIIDLIIDIIQDEEEEYQKQLRDYEEDQRQDNSGDEWKKSMNNDSEDTVLDEPQETQEEVPKKQEVDYSEWSKKDILAEVDRLLDAGEFEKIPKLQAFLK
jgi:hypothetical protein